MKIPSLLKTAVKISEKGDKIKNKLTYPFEEKKGDSRLYLLKFDGRTKVFSILGSVNSYGTGFDSYRDIQTFTVSTLRTDFGKDKNLTFGEAVGIATHLARTPQRDMFTIENGDEPTVQFVDFSYKINAVLESQKFDEQRFPNQVLLESQTTGDDVAYNWTPSINETLDVDHYELEVSYDED